MRNRRLHSDAHEPVGVIDGLPRVHRQLAAAIVGVAVVAYVEPRAVVGEDLDDLCTPLVRGAMKRRAPRVSIGIGVETQLQQNLHGVERRLM